MIIALMETITPWANIDRTEHDFQCSTNPTLRKATIGNRNEIDSFPCFPHFRINTLGWLLTFTTSQSSHAPILSGILVSSKRLRQRPEREPRLRKDPEKGSRTVVGGPTTSGGSGDTSLMILRSPELKRRRKTQPTDTIEENTSHFVILMIQGSSP
jgi:hypothetical protein